MKHSKQLVSSNSSAFLPADISIGQVESRCLHFTWVSNAALSRWLQPLPLDLTVTDSVFCSVHLLGNLTFYSSTGQSLRNSQTRLSVCGSKCLSLNIASQWVNVRFPVALISNHTIFLKALTPLFQSTSTSLDALLAPKHSSTVSDYSVRKSFESVLLQVQSVPVTSQ